MRKRGKISHIVNIINQSRISTISAIVKFPGNRKIVLCGEFLYIFPALHELWFLDLEPFCQNTRHDGVVDDALLDAAMERFCKVLQLPKSQLKKEYFFYLPIAIMEKKS